jgi:hypothetical protein
MVYQGNNSGNNDIYIKKVDSLGKETLEKKVNSLDSGEQINPDVKVLSDGKVIVVFASNAMSIDDYDIKGVIFSSTLSVYKSEFDIVSSLTSRLKEQSAPRICSYSTGFIVVYNEKDVNLLKEDTINVKFQNFDLNGNYINSDTEVNTKSDGISHYNPDCTCTSDGSFWVTWTKKDSSKTNYEINARRFSNTGSTTTSDSIISSNNSEYLMYSSIRLTSSGKLIIAYSKSSNSQGTTTSFFYKSYFSTATSSMSVTKLDTLINTSSSNNAFNSKPTIIDQANGAFSIAFNCNNKVSTSSLGDVCIRSFKTDYIPSQASEIAVNSSTSSISESNVTGTLLKNGEIALAWVSNESDGKDVFKMIMKGTNCNNVEIFAKGDEGGTATTNIKLESSVNSSINNTDKMSFKIVSITGGTTLTYNGSTPVIGNIYCINCLNYTNTNTGALSTITFTLIDADLLESPTQCIATITPCFMSCETCASVGTLASNNCLTCNSGYFPLSDNIIQCVNTLPTGYYFNSDTNQYKPCNIACKTCTGDTVGIKMYCSECNKGFNYAPGINSCFSETTKPANFYFKDNHYYQCYILCATCSKAGDETNHNCDKCLDNYTLEQNGMCTKLFKCYESCKTCSATGTIENQKCLTCNMGFYFVEGLNNCLGVNSSPEGYYMSSVSNTFKPCYSSCKFCDTAGSSNDHKCLICKSDYFPQYKTSNCYFMDQVVNNYMFNLENSMFMPVCYTSCKSCSLPGIVTNHQCLACGEGYVSVEGTLNCFSATQSIPGYYYDKEKNQFSKCFDRCATCTSKGDSNNNLCNSCKSGYLSVISSDINTDIGQIISSVNNTLTTYNCFTSDQMPSGYFFDKNTKTLIKCYSSCLSCNEGGTPDSNKCTTCNRSFASKVDDTSNCYSITSDIPGYYYDSSSNVFKTCPSSCATCNQNKCLRCKSGYDMTPNGICNLICFSSCATCNVLGNNQLHQCTSCNKGFIPVSDIPGNCLSNNLSSPPNGYFYNQITNEFSRCFKTCNSCSKAGNEINNNCINCISNFYPISDNPSNCYDINSPPKFYYLDNIFSSFFPCERPCDKCSENIKKYCTICQQSNLVYFNRGCMKDCPLNMKADIFNICRSCYDLNLFSFNNTCTDKCPEGYITNANKLCENLSSSNNSSNNTNSTNSSKEGCDINNPCKNNGKCSFEKLSNNSLTVYSCECTQFYSGKYCENQVNLSK